MALLSAGKLETELSFLPLWTPRAKGIRRQFEFPSFKKAVAFVNRVARLAEEHDHHPDIDIRGTKVALTLTTHSEGGLTDKDLELARELDAAYARETPLR